MFALIRKKEEVFTIKEFLGRQPIAPESKTPLSVPLYGYMGLDISANRFFSNHNFNEPYYVVFAVAGVLFLSIIIENIYLAHGNTRKAEQVETITKILMPIAFYTFLIIGIVKVFM